ncbi:MAG TPA: cupin domain-containing protein [Spirochaetia bacterium]|nr:cupin domain-containing protein [Spirochaetia bacterium]
MLIRHDGKFGWDSIPVLAYKENGSIFKDVTRQILFEPQPDLSCQLRYFEVGPGGHTTLERHQHAHCVIVIRGEGEAFVGDQVERIGDKDVVIVPSMTWHQFRATRGKPLGFLCIVNGERDRPMLPSAKELGELERNPKIAAFIRS